MKRKFSFLCLVFFLLTALGGCRAQKAKPYFNATVLEVGNSAVLVEPFEGSEELKSADRISVSTDVTSDREVPAMEQGTTVRIVYTGEIAETYPAQINTVVAIYLLDENGDVG